MISPTKYRRRLLLASLLGGLLGVVTSASNHGQGLAPVHASQLLDAAWTWVAVGLIPCFAARRWVQSALLSAVTLWSAVLCYDLADLHYGVYSGLGPTGEAGTEMTDWLNFGSDLIAYSIIAAVAATGLALLVALIRLGGPLGLLAQLIVPAFTLWGSYTRIRDAYLVSASTPALVDVNRGVAIVSEAVLVTLLVVGSVRLLLVHPRRVRTPSARPPRPTASK